MTIKDLKKLLNNYPENMEILETRYSDYKLMEQDGWDIVKAIDVSYKRGYIMRYPEDDWRLSDASYKKEIESVGEVKEYLHFHGN